jgi:hypothetical protein
VTASRRRDGLRRAIPGTAVLLLVVLLVGACGPGNTTLVPGSPGTSAAASPATSGEGPNPTSWPGGVIEAVLNLAKADSQIQAAGDDLAAAAAYEDLQKMWGAADGLATLIDRLDFEVTRIKDYPATQAAAVAYEAAFPDMLAGARQLRDSITAGDAAGLTTGSQRLAAGLGAYSDARRLIGPLAQDALLMQRLLVK